MTLQAPSIKGYQVNHDLHFKKNNCNFKMPNAKRLHLFSYPIFTKTNDLNDINRSGV